MKKVFVILLIIVLAGINISFYVFYLRPLLNMPPQPKQVQEPISTNLEKNSTENDAL